MLNQGQFMKLIHLTDRKYQTIVSWNCGRAGHIKINCRAKTKVNPKSAFRQEN